MQNEAVTKTYIQNGIKYPFGSHSTIKRIIGQGKTVLDVGCAAGQLGEICEGNIFYGVDGNEEAVKEASKIYKETKLSDLNTIPSKDLFETKFDFIVFADVLEHLLYPEKILEHFKTYLKDDGVIIVSLPNVALWRVRLNLLFGKFDYTDYGVMDRTHLHLYTFKTAKELLENAGLKVIEQRGATYSFGNWINHTTKVTQELLSVHVITQAKK
jgi:2-polyprenyl-3-methyl-5-hydroxy-6-metoxy-1,4-benzoquinol methylase